MVLYLYLPLSNYITGKMYVLNLMKPTHFVSKKLIMHTGFGYHFLWLYNNQYSCNMCIGKTYPIAVSQSNRLLNKCRHESIYRCWDRKLVDTISCQWSSFPDNPMAMTTTWLILLLDSCVLRANTYKLPLCSRLVPVTFSVAWPVVPHSRYVQYVSLWQHLLVEYWAVRAGYLL